MSCGLVSEGIIKWTADEDCRIWFCFRSRWSCLKLSGTLLGVSCSFLAPNEMSFNGSISQVIIIKFLAVRTGVLPA